MCTSISEISRPKEEIVETKEAEAATEKEVKVKTEGGKVKIET